MLIGEETLALVQEGVVAEMVEPLELKGKAEPVPAFRLLAVPGPPERSHAAVRRSRARAALREAWERALTQALASW